MASSGSVILNELATYEISHSKSDQQPEADKPVEANKPAEAEKSSSQEPAVLDSLKSFEAKVLGSRLAGKVAIVTGGGSGFGEAISKRFAEEGAKVVVADMDSVGGERVANATHPHSMYFVKTNVASEEDWEKLVENTLDKFGRIDILVNNAGTSYRNKVCCALCLEWDGADAV